MLLPKMISRTVVSIFVVAAIAAIFSLAIAMSVFVTFPSGQQEVVAQQDNTTAATTTSTTNQTMTPASSNKTFYLFNTELEGLDEATAGIPHYIYSLPVIVVNRGDSVTTNFFNIAETEEEGTEEEEEEATEEEGRHSFTIDTPPYSVDIDTASGESGNATFTADQEGIFQYYCKYHPPTMRGELVVLPSTLPGASPPST
jgi:plastocyanin